MDQTLHALQDMFGKRSGIDRAEYFRKLTAVFMHRPYRRMPESAWSLGYLAALAHGGGADRDELSEYCVAAGIDPTSVLRELHSSPDVSGLVESEQLGIEAYPNSMDLLKFFRASPGYPDIVTRKMQLGADLMMDLGNLYTAALPAWLAAGFEEAVAKDLELAGAEALTIGYGSGDAAEAIPLYICGSWKDAATKIGFQEAMRAPVNLNQTQYESMHDCGEIPGVAYEPSTEFILDRVGARNDHHFVDSGIEYYRFVQ